MAFLDGYPLREKKEIYQSGLVLTLLDAYQMGEKFSKPFIKTAFSCSTTWGRKIFTAKARFLIILVAYLLREEKYIFSKGLIFSLSRDLPLEGRKFFWEWLPKRPLSVGISEEKIIPWNPHISNFLAGYSLREENFFGKHLLKRPLPVGISREENFRQDPKKHPLSFLT